MPNTRSWRLWPLVGLVIVVGTAGSVLVAVVVAQDRGQVSDVVQAVMSVLAPTGGLVLWLWTRRRRKLSASADMLGPAADALAAAVREQWERAAGERRLRHPAPIPVRWRWSHQGVTSPVHEALGTRDGVRFSPLPGMAAATLATVDKGGLRDLATVYGGLDSGRVILLGCAGSGKSAAAILTVLDALNHRRSLSKAQRAYVPVPVLLTAHGWDPRSQRLGQWLAARLREEYPFLRSDPYGRDTADRLISDGRIALILDGFDEIADKIRPVAIRALDEQAAFRLMLLSRTDELTDAMADGHLHGAAALELLPVPAREAAKYLVRCQVQPTPPAWRRLAEHLRTVPDSPVSVALVNPLMLTLVRDTFPGQGEIDNLLAPGRFANRAEVEAYLLDRVLPAAYRTRLWGPPGTYSLEQARRWLGFLAAEMNRRDTRDLAWWHIREWSPPFFRVITVGFPPVIGFGTTVGCLFGVAFGPAYGVMAGVLSGLADGVVVGLVVGLRDRDGPGPVIRVGRYHWNGILRWGAHAPGLAAGLASGLTTGILAGVAAGPERGAVVGLATALGLGLAEGIAESVLEVRRARGPRRLRSFRWKIVYSRTNVVAGLAFGIVLALALGLALGLSGGLMAGLGAGLAFGVAATLLFGLLNGLLESSVDAVGPMDPITSWRRDRQSGLTEAVPFGLTIGLGLGLAAGVVDGIQTGIIIGIVAGIVDAAAFTIAVSQSWHAAVGFLLLSRANLFPNHGIHFLEDARERGVLRTVGSVYQFHHARLQDQLAATYNMP